MRSISRFAAAAAALSLSFLVSCGAGAPAGPQTLSLTGNDAMQFSTKVLNAEAGAPITIEFQNVGEQAIETMGHNLVVLKAGVSALDFQKKLVKLPANEGENTLEKNYLPGALRKDCLKWTKVLGPGESTKLELGSLKKGNYSYVCTFPGHIAMMQGTLQVK